MFTGIILAVGKIAQVQAKGGDFHFKIDTGKLSLVGSAIGDSISVDGVCLTVIKLGKNYFYADVSNESITRTNLKFARVGTEVNLELALTPSTRMGGHIVSGHIDGLAIVISKQQDGRSYRFKFEVPDNLAKYIVEKGSICINGVSLTVNESKGALFTVNIVPHTLSETTLGLLSAGSDVNIEVDLLARYMERLMRGQTEHFSGSVSEELLAKSGFLD